MNKKIKCACKTVSTINMEGTDLLIEFRDGSTRSYSDGIKHYNSMRRKNFFGGVGPYYRSKMRDTDVDYKEIKKASKDKNVGK